MPILMQIETSACNQVDDSKIGTDIACLDCNHSGIAGVLAGFLLIVEYVWRVGVLRSLTFAHLSPGSVLLASVLLADYGIVSANEVMISCNDDTRQGCTLLS